MRVVHMMVGIPGSGKSTYVKELADQLKCEVVATDEVRNANPNWDETKIWPEVYRLCGEKLKAGQDIIYDATNITPKVRARFIEEVKKYYNNFNIGTYYFDTPWQECLRRIIIRNENPNERYLPPAVVSSYANNIIIPTTDEGFVFIKTIKYKE